MGSQPVDIKKEGEPRLLWKGEPRAWCTCPETEQASLPLSVRDPGTFLETPISIIPKAPGRHLTAWGKARNSNNPQDGRFQTAWMVDSGGKRTGGQQEGRGRRGSQYPPTGNQGAKGTGRIHIFDLHTSLLLELHNAHVHALLLESIFLCS